MTVTDAELKTKLAAMGQRAENWRKLCKAFHLDPETSFEDLKLDSVVVHRAANWFDLCRLYGLAPDASIDAVENAVFHTGFAFAVMSVMESIQDVAKAEKVATGNGKKGVTH